MCTVFEPALAFSENVSPTLYSFMKKVVQNSSLKKHTLGSAALYTQPPGFLSGRF